jgi:hypothetical protein
MGHIWMCKLLLEQTWQEVCLYMLDQALITDKLVYGTLLDKDVGHPRCAACATVLSTSASIYIPRSVSIHEDRQKADSQSRR